MCTCPQDYHGFSGQTCTPCPQNSGAPAGSRYASDCLCLPGFIKSNLTCVPCQNGLMVPVFSAVDTFSGNDLKNWQGADTTITTTECVMYGSMLGGAGVFADGNLVQKTYTDLCEHNSVHIKFALIALDGWEGESIALLVDNIEVRLSE
jgi:hypothetical protein